MNLLMVSGDRSALSGKRGAFWYTLEALRTHFGRIDVLCPRSQISGIPSFDLFDNVFIHPAASGLVWQPSWIVGKGAALIREHQHAIMTVQEYPPFYNGMGAMGLHRRTGIPYVLEVHHVVGHPHPVSLSEKIGRALSPRFLRAHARKAAAVRTVNGETKDLLVSFGIPEEKMHIVPSFYLDGDLRTMTGPEHPLHDLAFCGRIVANKGLPRLIEAIAPLERVTLLVVGDGPERGRCEKLVRTLGMQERMHFFGWLPTQKDVWRAMRSAKVFVMPSISEGGPRVALEAMACGMPVLSTRVGVMPDVIREGENGMLTDGTPDDLRAKILTLIEDDGLRRDMGKEAQRILERFERHKLIGEYAAFLQTEGKNRPNPAGRDARSVS